MKIGQRRKAERQPRPCPQCEQIFEGRPNAKHCSERCRKAAWRAKEKQEATSLRALAVTLARAAGLGPEDFA